MALGYESPLLLSKSFVCLVVEVSSLGRGFLATAYRRPDFLIQPRRVCMVETSRSEQY